MRLLFDDWPLTIARNPRRTPERDGRWRLNFRDADEASAYYTDSLQDAVREGCAMVQWLERAKSPPTPSPRPS